VLQFPIGWLADNYSKRGLLAGLTAATVVLALMMHASRESILFWPVLLALGACGYGVYTVVMAELGDRFSGHELVTGSSAFAVMWGLGALLGSVSGGWAMDLFGAFGLPLLIMFSYGLLLVGMVWRYYRVKDYPTAR